MVFVVDAEEASSEEASSIGARAKFIRRRRGLSLDVAAGLAGISKPYLSQLENGHRGFNRRGLLEDLAAALGCSVADLTGQPYLPPDRASADALAVLPAVSIALHECSLADVPDVPVLIARPLGNGELSTLAARRATEAAALTGRPELASLAGMTRVGALVRLGARHRARTVLAGELALAEPHADPSAEDTAPAEGYGMLHLAGAQLAAREGRAADADTHLTEARQLAKATGERNAYRYHFGPANVAAWSLAIAVELERGPSVAETLDTSPATMAALDSADRRAGMHLDLSRAYAQSGGDRDAAALQHIDTADRIAPTRLRNDPIAKDLVLTLDRRARRQVWELESLRNRFGVGSQR